MIPELFNDFSKDQICAASFKRPVFKRLREMGCIEEIAFSIDKASKIHPVIFYCFYIVYSNQVSYHPDFSAGIFAHSVRRYFAAEGCFKHIEPAHCDRKTEEFYFIIYIFNFSLNKIGK